MRGQPGMINLNKIHGGTGTKRGHSDASETPTTVKEFIWTVHMLANSHSTLLREQDTGETSRGHLFGALRKDAKTISHSRCKSSDVHRS